MEKFKFLRDVKLVALMSFVFINEMCLAQTSGSVTQGLGNTTIADLMPNCPSNHKTPIGTIQSSDNKTWIVPAENNFSSASKLSDLYNSCNNVVPSSLANANLNSMPTTVIDAQGEVITGYLFCDNYFELYINGILVGVDAIPFTPFNSSVVKFKVSKPYTIAVKLVDWEENVGLGSEIQSASSLYHPGDGGFIAQFSDGTVTDASWKAQTYYIAPIEDLKAVKELSNGTRSTSTATITPACNANCYGVHYDIPNNWQGSNFNDSSWPNASLYTAAQVTNQPAYTNFANTAWSKASFIWSSNLILDNVVLTRKTVAATNSTRETLRSDLFKIKNPVGNQIQINGNQNVGNVNFVLTNLMGHQIQAWSNLDFNSNESITLETTAMAAGVYVLNIQIGKEIFAYKLVKN